VVALRALFNPELCHNDRPPSFLVAAGSRAMKYKTKRGKCAVQWFRMLAQQNVRLDGSACNQNSINLANKNNRMSKVDSTGL
jgi:hypothetical protein